MTTEEQEDEQFYRDTESIAFPKLNDQQLSLLEPLGEHRVMKRGEVHFKAGQRDLGLAIAWQSGQPLVVVVSTFSFVKQFREFATLTAASGGPALSR